MKNAPAVFVAPRSEDHTFFRKGRPMSSLLHDGMVCKVGNEHHKIEVGARFRWFVIVGVPFRCCIRSNVKQWFVVTRCDCGKSCIETVRSLAAGGRTNCGCQKGWAHRTHGKSQTRMHRNWRGMWERCTYKDHKTWEQYGGRGITVCQEWSTFEAFESWALANGYKEGLKLDRIDNDLGYSPENCRFVTHEENCNNTRKVAIIEAFGERKSAARWSRDSRCKVSRKQITRRVAAGVSPELAITEPRKTRLTYGTNRTN